MNDLQPKPIRLVDGIRPPAPPAPPVPPAQPTPPVQTPTSSLPAKTFFSEQTSGGSLGEPESFGGTVQSPVAPPPSPLPVEVSEKGFVMVTSTTPLVSASPSETPPPQIIEENFSEPAVVTPSIPAEPVVLTSSEILVSTPAIQTTEESAIILSSAPLPAIEENLVATEPIAPTISVAPVAPIIPETVSLPQVEPVAPPIEQPIQSTPTPEPTQPFSATTPAPTPAPASAPTLASTPPAQKIEPIVSNLNSEFQVLKTKFSFLPKKLKILVGALVALIVIFAGGFSYLYLQNKKVDNTASAIDASKQKVADTVTAVGKLILLPTNETPQILTVSDPSKLQGQEFFANAATGDIVLIYSQAQKAILYRPSTNLIIAVAPINLTPQTSTTTPTVVPKTKIK
jgi:hypothetical protein